MIAALLVGETAVITGVVLSTLKIVDGPAPVSVFPAASEACAAATVIATVPSPVHPDNSTSGVAVVPSTTLIVEQLAPPDVSRLISPFANAIVVAPV